MADRCNISYYFLRDTNRKLAIPLPQTNVKKKRFSGAVLWIYWPTAGEVSWGFEGWLQTILPEIYHGTYVKQTKAVSLIRFCDKEKGKVSEALILKQVIQFQASWTWYFCRRIPWTAGRRWWCAVYMCGTNKCLKNLISKSCFLFSFFFSVPFIT